MESIDAEHAHGGKKSIKIAYDFLGRGYLELQWAKAIPLDMRSDTARIAIWVMGDGSQDFSNWFVRLVDAKGEVFQYAPPMDAVRTLNTATAWTRVKGTFKIAKYQSTWAPYANGPPDWPLRFLSFELNHELGIPAHGVRYIHDIVIAPVLQSDNPERH